MNRSYNDQVEIHEMDFFLDPAFHVIHETSL